MSGFEQQGDAEEAEEFEAERIIGDALMEDENGMIVRKWLVKWKGYDEDDDDTYEPEHYLRHLEIWKEYNERDKSVKDVMHSQNVLNLMEQYNELQTLNKTIVALTTNTANALLFSHQSLCSMINQKKMEKLIKNSQKMIVSKVSDFCPQEIYEGIAMNHDNICLYKACIKTFIQWIKNKKIENATIESLNMHKKLLNLLKFDDSELKYLCVHFLDLIGTHSLNPNVNGLEINILFKCLQQSKDKEMINNIVSILHKLSVKESNLCILIDKDICKYLSLICHSYTDINTLSKISSLLCNICKFKALSKENVSQICHSLSFLIMFDVSDVLKPAIYAYNQIFTFLVLNDKISLKLVLTQGKNGQIMRKEMEKKSQMDEFLVCGCIKRWKSEIEIPYVFNAMIKAYVTPFGNKQIKQMKFNKMERFVSLIEHKCDKIKSFDLILICCVIASAQKNGILKETLSEIVSYGVIDSLKKVYKGCYVENDLRSLMVLTALIEHATNDEVKLIMENEIFFPFVLKIACNQIIDEYMKNCICRAIKKVLFIYKKRWNVNVWELIVWEIEKLKTNKNVMEENKQYLMTLINQISK